jgi:amino acid transporter
VLLTVLSALAPFLGRRALVWFVNSGGLATVLAYFFVTISFIRLRKRYPDLTRPYRVPAPRLMGMAALLATVFFAVLYMPGSPSGLVWPQEWLILVFWAVLGIVFFFVARGRLIAMGRKAQGEAILGEFAGRLG